MEEMFLILLLKEFGNVMLIYIHMRNVWTFLLFQLNFVYLKKYTHCDSESEDGIECFSASAGI